MAFSQHNPYPSQRRLTYARSGMVATSQPQAAQVGRDILAQGGNAIDAAIATAAALTVVEPTDNGIGGDAFAQVWLAKDQSLHGLNASGPTPQALTRQAILDAGHETIPALGWIPVTVPGVPAAWASLSKRFGKLPFADVLAPAIRLAEEGFPVSPAIAEQWHSAHSRYDKLLTADWAKHWYKTYSFNGRAPKAGELFKNPDQAQTLRELAATECQSFYTGKLAEKIINFAQATGGYLSAQDLAEYQPEWVQPVAVNYRGVEVWELPPNGQGIIAQIGLNIAQGFSDFAGRDDVAGLHRQIEAQKLAQADGLAYIADPDFMTTDVGALLAPEYAQQRRQLIGEQAIDPQAGKPAEGGTVYLATADAQGNMVSYIQSNYHGFGSGLIVPDTGIALQNRGFGMTLDTNHPNVLEPNKRPFHTIIPGFLTQNGQALGPFGIMGGGVQAQAHMQVIINLLDHGLNPQAALDAPRWRWVGGKKVRFEQGYPNYVLRELADRGHEIDVAYDHFGFGRGQIILRNAQTGVLCGGTESRADSAIAVL